MHYLQDFSWNDCEIFLSFSFLLWVLTFISVSVLWWYPVVLLYSTCTDTCGIWQWMQSSFPALNTPARWESPLLELYRGPLYISCAKWVMYIFLSHHLQLKPLNSYVHLTVINFYVLGTTVKLVASQSVFGQAVDIWAGIAQWCKTPKVWGTRLILKSRVLVRWTRFK